MHEFSIMESVLNTVKASAEANRIIKIKKVKIIIGQMAMVVPDSMQFAFEALCNDNELLFKEAELEIEERAVCCLCGNCGNSFSPPDMYTFICPCCQSSQIDIIGGRELYLDYYEGEDE